MDDSVLEELREDNHRLTLRLDQVRQSLNGELEYVREELALKEREHKDVLERLAQDAKNRENELQERISELNSDLAGSREDVEKLKEQVETVKTNYDALKSRNNDPYAHRRSNNLSFTIDHYEALKDTLEGREGDLAKAKEQISSLSERLREYSEIVEADRSRIAEMTEDNETKQNTIVELQERVRQMEMERNEYIQMQQQRQLDAAAGGDGSGGAGGGGGGSSSKETRGNSLFSEVEERRVKVEDELRRLRERNALLLQENLELQATIETGDRRHSAVSNQLQILTLSEQQMIKELKKFKSEGLSLFDNYGLRLEKLRGEYLSRLTQYRDGNILNSDLEEVTTQRDDLLKANMNLDREIFNLKKELRYTQHMKTECETHLKILRIKMNDAAEKKAAAAASSPNKKLTKSAAAQNHSSDKKRSGSPMSEVSSSVGSPGGHLNNGVTTGEDTVTNKSVAASSSSSSSSSTPMRVGHQKQQQQPTKKTNNKTEEMGDCQQQ